MGYYFDTLPLHPQPKRFESLTSYLARLAEANNIQTIPILRAICFPDQKLGAIKSLRDSYPASFGMLPATAVCTESRLKETTFYHLGQKFGQDEPQALFSFLHSSIAPYLRYCPVCLKENGFYSLLWRFHYLQGCSEHTRPLLNECWHCGRAIPIWSSPLKIGVCPFCKMNLAASQPRLLTLASRTLTKEAEKEAILCSQDLEFLLTPYAWENDIDDFARRIGVQFAQLRQMKRLTVRKVSLRTELKARNIEAVESEYPEVSRVTFQDFFAYANCLGVSFRDIFGRLLSDRRGELAQPKVVHLSEYAVIEKVQMTVHLLRDLREPVTSASVHQMVQIPLTLLRGNSRVRALLDQCIEAVLSEQEKQIETCRKELYMKTQALIQRQEATGKPVTLKSLSEEVCLPGYLLRQDPHIRTLLNKAKTDYEYIKRRQEDELLTEINTAIRWLEERGERVTSKGIGHLLGRKPYHFMKYPKVNTAVRQAIQDPQQWKKK